MKADFTSNAADDAVSFIPVPKARHRYWGGVTLTTIWRWRPDPELGFPPIIKLRGRNYVTITQAREFGRKLQEQRLA
jgi:hypothetical protein